MAKDTKLAVRAKSEIRKLEPWEEALAAKAKKAQAALVVGIPRITHRGGILKIDDKKVEGNKIQVVIVAAGRMNTYFEKEFDPEQSKGETPDCYAFSELDPEAEAAMKPHPAAPKKQHDQCVGCQWNEYGSGKGNTKACGNYIKALVAAPNDDPESMVKSQIRQIAIPPGSLRPYANYMASIEDVSAVGPMGVVTEISAEPTDRGGHRLTFRCTGALEREQVQAVAEWSTKLERHLSEPFPVVKKEEEKPKERRKVKGQ